MKSLIFYLLALCAFETIFADQLEQDVVNLSEKFEDQMLGIADTFSQSIGKEADAAGIHTGEYEYGCFESSDKAMDRYYQLRMDQYNVCITEALKNKKFQSAQSCCEKALVALKNDEKLIHALAKTCIAKCAQPKANCTKEIQNLDTIQIPK